MRQIQNGDESELTMSFCDPEQRGCDVVAVQLAGDEDLPVVGVVVTAIWLKLLAWPTDKSLGKLMGQCRSEDCCIFIVYKYV